MHQSFLALILQHLSEKESNMAADMMNPKQRSVAKDYSSVNTGDFMGGVAPAGASMYQTLDNTGTASGPAQVVQGVYVAPEGGRAK